MVIRFASKPKSTVQLQEHMLFECLAIHSLDLEKQYSAAIVDILPGSPINIQNAIDQLAVYFDTQVFVAQYVRYNLTILTKEFTAIVQQFFERCQPKLYEEMKQTIRALLKAATKVRVQTERAHSSPIKQRAIQERNSESHRAAAAQAAAAAAQRQPGLEPLSLSMVNHPNVLLLQNASHDPIKTLLLFAFNTGHAYLPPLANGVLPHSSTYPDIMSETWDEDARLPAEVKALHGAILDLRVTQDTIERRVEQFRRRIKLDGYLPACGSCGIRFCFVDEQELDNPRQRSRPDERGAEDFFRVKPEPPPFSRLGLDDPLIQTLRLTEDQVMYRNRMNKYKHIFSAYEDFRNDYLKCTLHLHPPLIEHDPAGGEPKVIVSHACLTYMQKKLRQSSPKKPRARITEHQEQLSINSTYCIAEGYDFGQLDPGVIPPLSILESIMISQYVFYGTLVKLNAWRGIRQNALKGHIIAFKHTGPNAINRVSTLLFPWYDADEILDCIKVSFVGPRGIADRCLKALCLDGGLLRVDIKPLAKWLELLHACHPGYKHLQLPSRAQQDEIQAKLVELQASIIANAQLVHSKLSRHIEGRAGADIAAVRSLPEDHDIDEEDEHLSDSESSSSSDHSDDNQNRMVDIDDPELEQKLNFILGDTIIVDGTQNAEASATDILGSLLAMMKQNPDSSEAPYASLRTARNEEPVSEMGNTDILYYMALPTLFPFGRGLPEGSFALPSKIVRHLMLQYHNRHASDQRFCFSQFNMLQRHAASRSAALRVRNSKPAINDFMQLVREDTFQLRLQMAVEAPDGDDAKLLARQILPLVTSIGSSIPYSPSERKDMFSR